MFSHVPCNFTVKQFTHQTITFKADITIYLVTTAWGHVAKRQVNHFKNTLMYVSQTSLRYEIVKEEEMHCNNSCRDNFRDWTSASKGLYQAKPSYGINLLSFDT